MACNETVSGLQAQRQAAPDLPLATARLSLRIGRREGEERQDLLSDDVVVVRCVHLEGAVVGPQVDRGCDARDTALVDHLGRLGAANGELEVGILLPVSEEERELGQEAVVHVAHQFDGGWAGVAGDAALEVRGASDERFPSLKVVFVLYLQHGLAFGCGQAGQYSRPR